MRAYIEPNIHLRAERCADVFVNLVNAAGATTMPHSFARARYLMTTVIIIELNQYRRRSPVFAPHAQACDYIHERARVSRAKRCDQEIIYIRALHTLHTRSPRHMSFIMWHTSGVFPIGSALIASVRAGNAQMFTASQDHSERGEIGRTRSRDFVSDDMRC